MTVNDDCFINSRRPYVLIGWLVLSVARRRSICASLNQLRTPSKNQTPAGLFFLSSETFTCCLPLASRPFLSFLPSSSSCPYGTEWEKKNTYTRHTSPFRVLRISCQLTYNSIELFFFYSTIWIIHWIFKSDYELMIRFKIEFVIQVWPRKERKKER